MYYVIDRMEGDFALCEREDLVMVEIPQTMLPEGCREGSKLEERNGCYRLVDNTEDRARIREIMRRLFERGSE